MRPWLTLLRPEHERTYLDHQQRCLRKLHEGPLNVCWDRLPGESFYDTERLRLHGDELYQAYDLLYPRDNWTLSTTVLRLCGWRGLAALWIDSGQWRGKRLRFGSLHSHLRHTDFLTLADYLAELGFACELDDEQHRLRGVRIRYSQQDAFLKQLKPWIHRSMRHKLPVLD